MDEKRSLCSMQQEADEYIQQLKVGYPSPLARLTRLAKEVNELTRKVNHAYGEKSKKASEPDNSVAEELGGVLFVTVTMANSLDIDLTDVFEKNMEKFNQGDHNRFERKDKQKKVVYALKLLKQTYQSGTMQLGTCLSTRNTQERLEK